MAKCKKSNCREEAVPYGKRYCPQHLAEYKAKQAEYEKRQAALPDCESCGEKVPPFQAEMGYKLCVACNRRREAEAALELRERFRNKAFDELETVAELKEWIARYVQLKGLDEL